MSWQPMDTAPKDGSRVLVTIEQGRTWDEVQIAHWVTKEADDQKVWATDKKEWHREKYIRGWMPLPEPMA